jgi:lysozyme
MNAIEVGEKLRSQISRDEGRVSHAYQDSLGYWTIGVGHLIDDRKGGSLPEFIIDVLLSHDIEKVQKELVAALPWFLNLDPPRQAVLTNMAFNLGTAGLLKFNLTLAAVRDGHFSVAATQMLQSKWASQVGPRAHRLASQMETGAWV